VAETAARAVLLVPGFTGSVPPNTQAQPYRRRRPETAFLNRIGQVRLETYLSLSQDADRTGDGVGNFVLDVRR